MLSTDPNHDPLQKVVIFHRLLPLAFTQAVAMYHIKRDDHHQNR